MEQYFEYNYPGPAFELFGAGHLLSIAIIASVVAFLIWGWKNPSATSKRNARLIMLGVFLVIEISWHTWNVYNGTWTIQKHLPLHACSVSAWCSILVLITRSYRIYEIVFFIGLAGATQTVLTPDAGIYGLPHFRAIQTLAAHGMIIIVMTFMTVIEGYRPTWLSVWKALFAANIYMVFVTGVNMLIGSNYMYTLGKPASASILDMMGPWPWYLFWAEFLALGLFSIFYAPFAIADWRAKRQVAVTT